MHVLTCETILVKTYAAHSVKAFWAGEARSAMLCGLAVEVVNPDSVTPHTTLFYKVTGTPQQIARFERECCEAQAA